MLGLVMRLVAWDISRKRARLGLMVLTILTTLTTYIIFGAILDDVSIRAMQVWRSENPYDITVQGSGATNFASSIRSMSGVVRVDNAITVDVIVGSSHTALLALESDSLYVLEIAEGKAPSADGEIAIPLAWAANGSVAIGTELRVLAVEPGAEGQILTICGFLANKSRVPQQAIITPETAYLLGRGTSRQHTLLVALDGRASIETVHSNIQALSRALSVQAADGQYSTIQDGMGFASVLLSSMRGLVLVVTAAVMGALTHLTQRERAYQNGVLRAMGLPSIWLMVAPLFEGMVVFLIGSGLAFLLVPFLAGQIGLLSNTRSSVDLFLSQAGVFFGLGFGFILVSSITTAYRPITSLLRDVWGK